MENNLSSFDARLKSALENLEVPYEPATWTALEQRLPSAPAVPPDAVDKAVFKTLNNLEAAYQPNHWELLAQRMVEQTRLRRRLWASKLAEAAVFLLLLANLEGFLGDGTPQQPRPASAPLPNKPIAAKSAKKSNAAPHTAAQTPDAAIFESPANPLTAVSEEGTDTRAAKEAFGALLSPPATNTLTESASGAVEAGGLATLFSQPYSDIADAKRGRKDGVQGAAEQPSAGTAQQVVFAFLPTRQVAVSSALSIDKKYFPAANSPVLTPEKAARQSHFYVASFASLDHNRTQVAGLTPLTTPGYGGGFAVGYRKGKKWGVEAGLAYSRKNFRPRKEVEIVSGNINKGYYGSFIRDVDADMVTVPVKATRQLARMGKLTVQAVVALTTNIAAEKSYQRKSVYYPGFQQEPGGGTGPVQAPAIAHEVNGVLEGGPWKGNVYAAVGAGLRLEHPVGKRYAVFVETAYHRAVTKGGIGPKPSQINTLALQTGVMAGL